VDFRGFVPDYKIPGLYAGAAAFVTMSEFEAYGITVAESLAAGTPCVVRPTGGLIDWAERDDCVAVDPKNLVEGVHKAVGRLAPADRIQSWTDAVESVAAVYDSL
jgi:glycosyltransferase involved in cell wall biosynthesis